MSRLESAPSRIEVGRLTAALFDIFCRSFPIPLAAITLDIDDTCDRVPVSAEADGATPIMRQEAEFPLRPASVEMPSLSVVDANRVPAPAPAREPFGIGRRRAAGGRHEFRFHLRRIGSGKAPVADDRPPGCRKLQHTASARAHVRNFGLVSPGSSSRQSSVKAA